MFERVNVNVFTCLGKLTYLSFCKITWIIQSSTFKQFAIYGRAILDTLHACVRTVVALNGICYEIRKKIIKCKTCYFQATYLFNNIPVITLSELKAKKSAAFIFVWRYALWCFAVLYWLILLIWLWFYSPHIFMIIHLLCCES